MLGQRAGGLRYEVLHKLATGGMAEIFLARTSGPAGFAKHVVLKKIRPEFAHREGFVDMFLDEARLTAKLQHQNIAQVYDFGELDDGVYFFTMEYLHGDNLAALLRAARASKERLPLAHALTIIAECSAGLDYAHRKEGDDGQPLGIVHRDVSPSNILITYEGAVKLVDFGVAKAAERSAETRGDALKGKIAYMSPEQCQGHELDHRSDVFSLGIVLFEATTGTRLFRTNKDDGDFVVMERIVREPVPRPSERVPDYPEGLAAIVLKALAKDADDRFQSARGMLQAIESFAADSGLPLSTSALSQYVTRTLGNRPEPWRRIDDDSDPTVDDSAEAFFIETAAVTREAAKSLAPDLQVWKRVLTHDQSFDVDSLPTPGRMSAALHGPHRPSGWLWALAGAIGLAVGLAIALMMATRAPDVREPIVVPMDSTAPPRPPDAAPVVVAPSFDAGTPDASPEAAAGPIDAGYLHKPQRPRPPDKAGDWQNKVRNKGRKGWDQ